MGSGLGERQFTCIYVTFFGGCCWDAERSKGWKLPEDLAGAAVAGEALAVAAGVQEEDPHAPQPGEGRGV